MRAKSKRQQVIGEIKMSNRNRKQQKRAKRQERDRKRERRHKRPVKPVQVVISERIKNRFRADEIQVFLNRTFEKFNEARRTLPRQNRMWLSQYRTLYGEIAVVARETGLVAVTYFDEVPADILAAFPTLGTRVYKFSDAEWAAYAKAIWQLTDGKTGGNTFDDVPKDGALLFRPHGEHQMELIRSDGQRMTIDYAEQSGVTQNHP